MIAGGICAAAVTAAHLLIARGRIIFQDNEHWIIRLRMMMTRSAAESLS